MKVHTFKDRGQRCVWVRITQAEAWSLVQSFAEQVLSKNPNVGRLESQAVSGEYVTIAVMPQGQESFALVPDARSPESAPRKKRKGKK